MRLLKLLRCRNMLLMFCVCLTLNWVFGGFLTFWKMILYKTINIYVSFSVYCYKWESYSTKIDFLSSSDVEIGCFLSFIPVFWTLWTLWLRHFQLQKMASLLLWCRLNIKISTFHQTSASADVQTAELNSKNTKSVYLFCRKLKFGCWNWVKVDRFYQLLSLLLN